MDVPENNIDTFPNRMNVEYYIVVLTNPLKQFMISTLKKCKGLLSRIDPTYGTSPKPNDFDEAIRKLEGAKEIHGLADFFIKNDWDRSDCGYTFKYAYCRTKKIKPYTRGQLASEGDRFQRWIKELHDGRNLVTHLKDDSGNFKELDNDLTRYYGSLMILLAKDIEGRSNNDDNSLSQKIAKTFGLERDDKSLNEVVEKYKTLLDEQKMDNEYQKNVNRAIMDSNSHLCSEIDKYKLIAEELSERISKMENEKQMNLKLEELKDRAESGDAEAQYFLAIHYSRKDSRNANKAFKWMTDSANGGYLLAQLTVLLQYIIEAKNWNEKAYKNVTYWCSQLANRNIPQVNVILGDMYATGDPFVEQSYEKAFEYYMKAAEQNELIALLEVGNMYCRGRGVKQSYEKAFEWIMKAAEQNDTRAQYFIGECYYHGTGIEQSYEESFKWFMKAAELEYADAQYYIGILYYAGNGIIQSYDRAFEWFLKAAVKNNTDAQVSLGGMYFQGIGTKLSHATGLKWIMKAAEQENSRAKEALELSTLSTKDGNTAYPTIGRALEAAKNGETMAQEFIGSFYESDPDSDQFIDDAIKWYKKAAESGSIFATKRLETLNSRNAP